MTTAYLAVDAQQWKVVGTCRTSTAKTTARGGHV